MFQEKSLNDELKAMEAIVDILTPFPKAQRSRITDWALTRVNSQAQKKLREENLTLDFHAKMVHNI